MEAGKQVSDAELTDLRAIVKKLAELPAVPAPAPKGKSLLQQIEELIFPPKVS